MAFGLKLSDVKNIKLKEGNRLEIVFKFYVVELYIDDQNVLKNLIAELREHIEKPKARERERPDLPDFYKGAK
jgi:hypothetical protein